MFFCIGLKNPETIANDNNEKNYKTNHLDVKFITVFFLILKFFERNYFKPKQKSEGRKVKIAGGVIR